MNLPPIDPPPRTPFTPTRRVDATRLARRITKPDEITTQHRTGVVSVVNGDGTIDVDVAGEVLPGVPLLQPATVGAPVQIMAWQGDLIAVAAADGPRGVLGYAEVSSSQTGIGSGITALTGLSVTVDIPANRTIRITGYVRNWNRTAGSAAGDVATLDIRRNSNRDVRHGIIYASTVTLHSGTTVMGVFRNQPGTAVVFDLSHTRVTGSHTTTMDAAAGNAFILVEDIGSA